ncbi:LytTR family transcriptional regulator [Limosilactobacillus agrestis]|uniref:LytTR family transcriptional regulator n=1 Tax=Limosilactobacillus agrestis TaxID=2759748 RepID=A0A7W3UHE0_9LACO|nr:LytTR family DNA-binding domain-containing protein [Limosilactobacillus agrestis]MBB1095603.1 LytTR family transcriptional regulator [Limosilactobacillus agrestis]MCD7130756.1 LytTR family transcriptional regulator [Limosilactobacillus agrestis]
MKITYQQNDELPEDDIRVNIVSKSRTIQVERLLNYLTKFTKSTETNIPVKTDDQFLIIKPADLLMVEVNQRELTFYTVNRVITTTGKLKDIQDRLNDPKFIQVSRHAIINIDYLQSVENGFSGTMVAKLSYHVKTSISRKYVPVIKENLGL